MSKSAYHFCNKYDEWLDIFKNKQYTEEKVDCDLNCEECEYNDIVWVEED